MSVKQPVIITIARQLGSGGSEIAQRVARRLDFHYIDRQILQQAAAALGLKERDLAPRCERVQGFWAKLLQPFAAGTPADVFSPPPFQVPSDEQIVATERHILMELAAKGDCVVVGHAGFRLLRGQGRLLNIFVYAPTTFRMERILRHYGARDEAEARAMMEQADRDRERYVREVTGLLWQDARNYHVCFDAERVGLDAAVARLSALARRMVTVGAPA